jgi:hypothetical protein
MALREADDMSGLMAVGAVGVWHAASGWAVAEDAQPEATATS